MSRLLLAEKYCTGYGLEIGAGHNPWPIAHPPGPLYVDRCTRAELLPQFPIATRDQTPETDILDDGFNLDPGYGSFDYVVSSHVLEHTPRPAAALDNWLTMQETGGHIVAVIPNKDHTFDINRAITSWTDLTEGNEQRFRLKQFTEWYSVIDKLSGPALDLAVTKAEDTNAHIHFAVWDYPAFELFIKQYTATRAVELMELTPVGFEIFFVLRKK